MQFVTTLHLSTFMHFKSHVSRTLRIGATNAQRHHTLHALASGPGLAHHFFPFRGSFRLKMDRIQTLSPNVLKKLPLSSISVSLE